MPHHNNTTHAVQTGRESAGLLTELRARIRSGELAPGTFLPTVRRLSAAEGVAHGTAWRALKALEAEGLVEARPRRGYRVLAARPAPAAGATVAYVLDQDNVLVSWDLLYRQLLESMEHAAAGGGVKLLKLIMNAGEEDLVIERLESSQLDGLVLDSLNRRLLDWAVAGSVPAVVIDDWDQGLAVDSVVQGNFEGGELAAGHLLEAGCRRIAWLGQVSNHHGRARYGGVTAALSAAGAKLEHDVSCGLSPAELLKAARRVLSGSRRPDGVIALWHPAAEAVFRAARALGLELGRDVRLVGWCCGEIYEKGFAPIFDGAQVPAAVTWSAREMVEVALARLAQRRTAPTLPVACTRLAVELRPAK
jgi:LacI family transcriptional regulator